MAQARVPVAANCLVRCDQLQPTLNDRQADRHRKWRSVNRVGPERGR
jgi:hypothetical protein